MASSRSTLQWLCSLLFLVTAATALKFELRAHGGHESHSKERCIRNFVNKDTLVVVKSAVGGFKGDGMVINIAVRDTLGNEYGRARDVVGESKQVFTSHEDAAFDVCYENLFDSNSRNSGGGQRDIELDVDIGADAKDWDSIKADEKLKPVEADLRRIEELTGEIVTEMEYLRHREQKLRDTNESTNTRVKWFGVMTTWLLVGLWAWQILYLRAYFRSKHLI